MANAKYKACEELNRTHCEWNSPKDYDGTSAPSNHAETEHSLLPKVAGWINVNKHRLLPFPKLGYA